MPMSDGAIQFGGSFAASLLANAATGGLRMLAVKKRLRAAPPPTPESKSRKSVWEATTSAVREATREWGDSDQQGPTVSRAKWLLVQPATESLLRQLFATELSSPEGDAQLESARRQFTTFLLRDSGDESERVQAFAERILAVVQECARNARLEADPGELARIAEAESGAPARALIATLRLLDSMGGPDLDTVSLFATQYRARVIEATGQIEPPHFDRAVLVPLESVYVEPILSTAGAGQSDGVSLAELLPLVTRTVVLGNPGAGKSTLVQAICQRVAREDNAERVAGRSVLPVPVSLLEYSKAYARTPCSIVEYISQKASADYQMVVPDLVWEHLLATGRCLVLLDGLDELADTVNRQRTRESIRLFCAQYPDTPLLVTSRHVGYASAPLPPQKFSTFVLQDFNQEQVREYVRRWFATDAELRPRQEALRPEDFLEESDSVADLRANPLMLSLLCLLYRGYGYIPENRSAVYEKCSVMLFEKWDSSRRVEPTNPLAAQMWDVVEDLAIRMMTDPDAQTGLPFSDAQNHITDYLTAESGQSEGAARQIADEFLRFCESRAWVLTRIGTLDNGEPLMQFTHRTFLEYFSARHLARAYARPEELADVLMNRIEASEWDMIGALSMQIKDRFVRGGSESMLNQWLDQYVESGGPESVLSFCGRCLEFAVPSCGTTARVAQACIRRALMSVGRHGLAQLPTLVVPLMAVHGLNLDTVSTVVAEECFCFALGDEGGGSDAASVVASWLSIRDRGLVERNVSQAGISSWILGGGDRALARREFWRDLVSQELSCLDPEV